MATLLKQLALTPAQVRALPDDLRTRVVDFLLRWEAYAEAQQCLAQDSTNAALEMRARAWRGQGRLQEAADLYQERLRRSVAPPTLVALAHLYIESGDFPAATGVIAALQNNSATAPLSTQVRGDLFLAQGQLDAAEQVFQQLAHANRENRQPFLGLVQVYERRGDLVNATAFAHKAIDRAARSIELSVPELVALRNFFQRTADTLRVQQLNEQLIARFDRDRQRLLQQLGQSQTAPPPPPQPAVPTLAPVTPIQDATVTAAERRLLSQQAQRLFGYTNLLPGQAEVMAAVARGEHVLAILPTGAGKSLCYQLPAFTRRRADAGHLAPDRADEGPGRRAAAAAAPAGRGAQQQHGRRRTAPRAAPLWRRGTIAWSTPRPKRLRQVSLSSRCWRAPGGAPGDRRGALRLDLGP
jgi:tetratricopeptide (TPR) repeat protein